MFDKRLQGATVTKVYWAVNHHEWMGTIGEEFSSFRDAEKFARELLSPMHPKSTISTRMVFEYHPNRSVSGSGSLDTVVESRYVTYEENIRSHPED